MSWKYCIVVYIYGSKKGRGVGRERKYLLSYISIESIPRKDCALKGKGDVRYPDCVDSNIETRHKTGQVVDMT